MKTPGGGAGAAGLGERERMISARPRPWLMAICGTCKVRRSSLAEALASRSLDIGRKSDGKRNQEVPGFKVRIVFPITPIHLLRQVVVPAPGSSLMPRFLSGQDDHGGSGTAGAAEEIDSKSISDPQGLRGPVLLI